MLLVSVWLWIEKLVTSLIEIRGPRGLSTLLTGRMLATVEVLNLLVDCSTNRIVVHIRHLNTKGKAMRLIVAGTRSVADQSLVDYAVNSFVAIFGRPSQVLSGTAQGVDRCGEDWATRNEIPVVQYEPDWQAYGTRAGPIRNERMAKNADALVAVWDGRSRGTSSMIDFAHARGLTVLILNMATRRVDVSYPLLVEKVKKTHATV